MTNKIFRNMLIVGLLSMILTACLSIATFFNVFEAQIERDLKEEAKSIAVAVNHGVEAECFNDKDIRITLVGVNGNVIYDSHGAADMGANYLEREEVVTAVQSGEGGATRISATMEEKTYYYAVRLDNLDILRVSMNVDVATKIFFSQFYYIIIIGICVILLSLLVSYQLSKKIVKPINEMTDNLDNIEKAPYKELKPFADKIKSQRKEEKRLAKIKRQFTANVSHELKTPLTSISGYAELMQSGMVSGDDVSKIGKIIYKESQRLMGLTHDIIQLSQLEEYDFKPFVDFVDVYEAVESCVETLEIKASKKNVALHFDGEAVKAKGTKTLIDELAYNIIENAIKYNVENGEVFVSVKDEDDYAVLTVKDTGLGIPEKYQERVFERFFCVDKSRSKATGGTGLGLAIVKHTVDYLGGTISLESEEGVGTTIIVRLLKK